MKKFYYIVGAVVTAAAIFAFVAVMLKKLKVSLSIEGIDDVLEEEEDNGDITLTIENDETEDSDVIIKEEIESMLDEEDIWLAEKYERHGFAVSFLCLNKKLLKNYSAWETVVLSDEPLLSLLLSFAPPLIIERKNKAHRPKIISPARKAMRKFLKFCSISITPYNNSIIHTANNQQWIVK